jgi:hypothetical protein
MHSQPSQALLKRRTPAARCCHPGEALALVLGLAGTLALRAAEPAVSPEGGEYAVSRLLPGDQTSPRLSLTPQGGYAVWQDNGIDGDGFGIGAVQLNGSLSPIPTRLFRVNEQAAGEQEKPGVQMLADGGAVFVWQGGKLGQQDIWARFVGPTGTFTTGDVRVNTYLAGQQGDPVLTRLADGSIVVVWSSHEQDGHLQGIFGQRLSAAGETLGPEFQVNQFVAYNQRTPAVTTLDDGRFVVAWVTEQQRFENSVDVYARLYAASGEPASSEFRLNATANLCATPDLAPGWGGGFVAVWSERALANLTNMWDVVVGKFDASGQSAPAQPRFNVYEPHNQFSPRLAALGGSRLVVWTSLWQDGSREGIYGRLLSETGAAGDEFLIPTATASQQIQPAVASDGAGRFLVAWAGFLGGNSSFEILGQRYSGEQAIHPPPAPVLSALDSYSLMVSWAPLAGYADVAGYRLFVDGAATPVVTAESFLVLSDLDPASTHSVRLAYELDDGRVSPLSEPATAQTWGRDRNHDGLPDDWQTTYWGIDAKAWPLPSADSDGDGASNLSEFLAGTDPVDAASALRISIQPTAAGLLLQWNAVAGSVYQLQVSSNLATWSDAAGPAFAPGNLAASVIAGGGSTAYYRVIRVR